MSSGMIGSNTINLNEATLIVALQHYFDTVLFAEGQSPKVTGIDCSNSNYTKIFVISTNKEIVKKAEAYPSGKGGAIS